MGFLTYHLSYIDIPESSNSVLQGGSTDDGVPQEILLRPREYSRAGDAGPGRHLRLRS